MQRRVATVSEWISWTIYIKIIIYAGRREGEGGEEGAGAVQSAKQYVCLGKTSTVFYVQNTFE